MMMNSILGFEAGSVGKTPAATGESSRKSTNSNSFADHVASQPGRENQAGETVPGKGEPAETSAKAESDTAHSKGSEAELDEAAAELTKTEAGHSETEAEVDPAVDTANFDASEAPVANVVERPAIGPDEDGQARPASAADAEGGEHPGRVDLPSGAGRLSGGHSDEAQLSASVSAGAKPAGSSALGENQAAENGGRIVTNEGSAQAQASGSFQAEAVLGSNAAERSITSANPGVERATEAAGTARVPLEAPVKAVGIARAQPQAGGQQSSVAPAQGGTAGAAAQAHPVFATADIKSQVLQADGQQTSARPDGSVNSGTPVAPGIMQAAAAGQTAPKAAGLKAETESAVITSEAPSDAEAAESGRLTSGAFKGGEIRSAPAMTAPQPLQPATAILQPLMAGGLGTASLGTELLSGSEDLAPGAFGLSGEVPGLTQLLTEASIGTGTVHRPETPRMVAAQLAEAFAAKGEQKVEVSLNPQELGHVKMRVVASETGITMIIQTERPETGDLMRRHIHELAEEFRRMGYDDISFEFSGGQTGGQSADDADGGTGSAAGGAGTNSADASDGAATITQNLRLGETGVDMRV